MTALFVMVILVTLASFAAPPSDAAPSSSRVRVTARVRPAITVEYGAQRCLVVRSNAPWQLVIRQKAHDATSAYRLVKGGKTGDAGRLIRTSQPILDFAATVSR